MYHVKFSPDAETDLADLSKFIAQRILKKIRWLAENFDVITTEPLTGQWKGFLKLRVGDYRILYTFNTIAQTITIHIIKHRKEVYKTK